MLSVAHSLLPAPPRKPPPPWARAQGGGGGAKEERHVALGRRGATYQNYTADKVIMASCLLLPASAYSVRLGASAPTRSS